MYKCFIAFLLFLCIHLSAQTDSKTNLSAQSTHPYLLLKPGDELLIKQSIKNSPAMGVFHHVIMTESEKMLILPSLRYEKTGRRLLSVSRECLRRVFYLSYAYRMTGNTKYAQRAEAEMLAVSSFADWNPSHFLDVAEMTMAVAIGYDWTYDRLSASTRETISKAIIRNGIMPSMNSKYNGWLNLKNNWNQVCNAGIMFGAIAVRDIEPELSQTIIGRSLHSVSKPMEEYEPDGTYPEGVNYWNYGTSFNVMLISAAETLEAKELFSPQNMPGFMRSAFYSDNMVGPTGNVFNYSDGSNPPERSATIYWFAKKLKDASLLWSERFFTDNDSFSSDRLLPAALIWGAGINFKKVAPPKATFWIGQGINPVCLMRTSWTDKNAIFLGFKSGTPSASHGHMDVGSFVLEANGERWIDDFGKQEYESLESRGIDLWNMKQKSQRWSIFRYNNVAHSTLTFNDSLQRVSGACHIEKWSDKPTNMSATSDLTAVYAGQVKRVVRTASLINKSHVVIEDKIETGAVSTKVRWNLLTEAQPTLNPKTNSIELKKNGKKMLIKVKSPSIINLKTWPTTSKNEYDTPNPNTWFVGFEVQLPENATTILKVQLIPE